MGSETTDSSAELRIEVLGPVEAQVAGRPVALEGKQRRTLLAVLALMDGRAVSADRLIDELWGEHPPARPRDSLRMHVSRLRKVLAQAGAGDGRLVSRAGGYVLNVRPGGRDVDRWEQALADARRARESGELSVARDGIANALGVWRGEALGGATSTSWLVGERNRLEEQRLGATVDGIELDLELGRHGELLGQLDALVGAHPFQEHLVELQMLALYRCGRQADALTAFRAARRRFVEELGIEPSQPLRDLHEDVLRHSPALASPSNGQQRPTPSARRLPAPLNRTIGREHDVDAVAALLRVSPVRLLTLTGPGGVGKTRLAVETARTVQADFADGCAFVALAALERPEDVSAAVVAALGVVVLAGESAAQAAERFLAAKHLLLIADNLEHLLPGAAPFIGGLLGACPRLTVLATSREALHLQSEERYPVAPLAAVAAGALFCERARAMDPAFALEEGGAAAVAEICARVDGLPLAIELAAARCALLSPGEIAARLDTALGALGAGADDAPARHQTLRATIDWSHDLLDETEQRHFARFAVFAGGATVEAAETITGADLGVLDHLVAKSLLVRRGHDDGPTRIGMLETIRAYAGERFAETADVHAVREGHYRYYLALAQRHGTERALFAAAGRQHLARLDADVDNLHAAVEWAIAEAEAEPALALVSALGCYWVMRNRYADAVDWIDRALDLPGADAHPALQVCALCSKSKCLWQMGSSGQPAVVAAMEAVARRHGDPVTVSRALRQRVDHEINNERLDVANTVGDEALRWAKTAGDEWEIAAACSAKAIAAQSIAELRERVDTAAGLLGDAGNVHGLATLLSSAAYAALCLGSEADATEFCLRAAPMAQAMDSRFLLMINSGNLGVAALLTGATDTASRAFREELRLCREMVVRPAVFEALQGLSAMAALDGDDERAATLVGAAATHRYEHPGDPIEARIDKLFLQPARTRCRADTWRTAAREGSALSFDEAIAYGLEEAPARGGARQA